MHLRAGEIELASAMPNDMRQDRSDRIFMVTLLVELLSARFCFLNCEKIHHFSSVNHQRVLIRWIDQQRTQVEKTAIRRRTEVPD